MYSISRFKRFLPIIILLLSVAFIANEPESNRWEAALQTFETMDNDIARGKSPETVLQDFRTFVHVLHDSLPETHIAYIAIKPSIAR